jgi:arylsulfatase A-like enzyme
MGVLTKTQKGSRYKMKNVLLLMVDDMIPVIGNHREAQIVPTPNLDRLVCRGLLFPHAQTPTPICNPAWTAIFTGLQPFSNGVYRNDLGLLSLPKHLRASEYVASGTMPRKFWRCSTGEIALVQLLFQLGGDVQG